QVFFVMARHHHRESGSGPSQRALRAGELIRHAFAQILSRGDVHDPVLEAHMITVPEVRMSPDLRQATVYVMPLGGRDEKAVLEALNRNKRFLRGEIAHRVNMKFAPDIHFRIDERFAEADRIDKLLRSPEAKPDLDHDAAEARCPRIRGRGGKPRRRPASAGARSGACRAGSSSKSLSA